MTKTFRAVAVSLMMVVPLSQARADDLKILSAGALEPAMAALADGFRRRSGNAVRIEFATAAEIRERGGSPLAVELVAAPEASIAELARANRLASTTASLGRIGLGVVVPVRAAAIDVSTPAALRAALLAAKTVVYNRASSGQGIEALIQKLGIAEQLASRTVRFPDAESVMRHMMSAGEGAIGFGAPTAISLYVGSRLRYAGPVPVELQSYTRYAIAPTPNATPLARAFLGYLDGDEARSIIGRAGVEQAR
jgi:molybdate transport system substrate-binding protein